MNRILILLSFIFFSSCGLLSESNKPVEYNSSSFETFQISKPPNYKNLNAWAVHPSGDLGILSEFETTNEKFPVDVFFIYPTMHSNKNDTSWNADIFDQNTHLSDSCFYVTYYIIDIMSKYMLCKNLNTYIL